MTKKLKDYLNRQKQMLCYICKVTLLFVNPFVNHLGLTNAWRCLAKINIKCLDLLPFGAGVKFLNQHLQKITRIIKNVFLCNYQGNKNKLGILGTRNLEWKYLALVAQPTKKPEKRTRSLDIQRAPECNGVRSRSYNIPITYIPALEYTLT